MYSSNGNGASYERVSPVPQGWNYEDPIGDELSGRGSKSSGISSRNRPTPIPHTNTTQIEQYNDDYDSIPAEPVRYEQSVSTSAIPRPIPKSRHDHDDVTVKNVKINLEINIKINLV
jgi:hypothetical protein